MNGYGRGKRYLTISISLVRELARSETEEWPSFRRSPSSGGWPLGLLPGLLPPALREQRSGSRWRPALQEREDVKGSAGFTGRAGGGGAGGCKGERDRLVGEFIFLYPPHSHACLPTMLGLVLGITIMA